MSNEQGREFTCWKCFNSHSALNPSEQTNEWRNKQTSISLCLRSDNLSTNWDNGYSTLHLQCIVFVPMFARESCIYYYCCCCSYYCCYLKCVKHQQLYMQQSDRIQSNRIDFSKNSPEFMCLSFIFGGNYNFNQCLNSSSSSHFELKFLLANPCRKILKAERNFPWSKQNL